MTADIVQELNDEARSCINLADGAQNAIVNERENRLAMQFSRAAAEIVRLRGEVAKWQGLAEAGVTLAEIQRRREQRIAKRDTPAAVPAGEAVAPACYGMRRKGAAAIIGIVPNKVAAKPATSESYLADYEEVPLYTTPPAPVQAAPQEGEVWEWRDDLVVALRDRARWGRGGQFTAAHDTEGTSRLLEIAADAIAAACELGAVPGDDPGEFGVGIKPNPKARYWQERADFWRGQALLLGYDPEVAANVDAALQHRGDSQEVGRG